MKYVSGLAVARALAWTSVGLAFDSELELRIHDFGPGWEPVVESVEYSQQWVGEAGSDAFVWNDRVGFRIAEHAPGAPDGWTGYGFTNATAGRSL